MNDGGKDDISPAIISLRIRNITNSVLRPKAGRPDCLLSYSEHTFEML
jgi:hypothetical protein